MSAPTFLSLFSGIGGLDLGLERAGWECVGQVENDPFCTRVLAKHWPDVPRWGDIKELDPHELPRADLICGGFPCQPVSLAGRRRGQEDERWLWPELCRIVRALRPRWVLLENVPGLLVRGMGDVLGDLAASGYDAEWDCIPAAAVGANHRRDRVWVVAYPASPGHGAVAGGIPGDAVRRNGQRNGHEPCGSSGDVPDPGHGTVPQRPRPPRGADRERPAERSESGRDGTVGAMADSDRSGRWQGSRLGWPRPTIERDGWWAVEPHVGRVAHGVPARVDRLRALGNAVVPQVAELIGCRILEASR